MPFKHEGKRDKRVRSQQSTIILSKVETRPRLRRLVICLILFSTGLISIYLYGCRTTQVTGYWHKENIPNELQRSSLVEKQRETDISDCLKKNPGDVDENNHFTSLGDCGRRFLCLGKRD